MPKLRTHKKASRRFNVAGSGRLSRSKSGASDLRRSEEQAREAGIAAGCPCELGRWRSHGSSLFA